jgi:uncharacterized protein
MDVFYELNGAVFVWDETKAATNIAKHDGISFEQAATVFFDPLFILVDATRQEEARNAIIGHNQQGQLLFVVHIEYQDEHIRIISARKATKMERKDYDSR